MRSPSEQSVGYDLSHNEPGFFACQMTNISTCCELIHSTPDHWIPCCGLRSRLLLQALNGAKVEGFSSEGIRLYCASFELSLLLTTMRSLKRKTSLWCAACFWALLTSVTSKSRLQHTSLRWGTERTYAQRRRVDE